MHTARIIGINVLVVVAVVAGLEALFGLFVSQPGTRAIRQDFYLNHTWTPNGVQLHSEWVADNPGFPEPYIHQYNNEGWLETYDVVRDKPEGVVRIFYLGDSFIEGTVPMTQSLPSRVEQALNETSGATQYEVINTGTSSYSPTLMYLVLRHRIVNYQPDLVVVNIDMTDDYDDWKYAETLIVDDNGDPLAAPPRDIMAASFIDTEQGAVAMNFRNRLSLWLIKHSNLFRWLLERRSRRAPDAPVPIPRDKKFYPRWAWCEATWTEDTQRNVAHSLGLIKRIRALARRHQFSLVLSSTPHYWQYNGDKHGRGPAAWSQRPHQEIARLARELGVPYIDSFGRMRNAITGSAQPDFYYTGDMHFNPRGYALWAESHIAGLRRVLGLSSKNAPMIE